MATIFAAPNALGTGDGLTAGNARSLASACSVAVAGDTIKLTSGNYTSLPQPAHNGTSGNPITLDGTGFSPVIEGGFGAANGGAGPTDLSTLSWSGSPISGTGSFGTNIYRATLPAGARAQSAAIWANDYSQTVSGHAPLGVFCTPQNMINDIGYQNHASVNPNKAIHTYASNPQAGAWGQPVYTDTYQYFINTDGTIDMRMNNDSPANYVLFLSAQSANGLSLSSASYLTYKGIAFRRWHNHANLASCSNIIIDTCDFRYCVQDGIVLSPGTSNCTIKNSTVVGCGSMTESYADMFVITQGSNNNTVDNCTIQWGGHDLILSYQSPASTGNVITNCDIGFCGSGFNFTGTAGNESSGWTIAQNFVHDCGLPSMPEGWDGGLIHMGMEISALLNSTIRHNVFKNCGHGIYISGGKNVKGNKFYHNTFYGGASVVNGQTEF